MSSDKNIIDKNILILILSEALIEICISNIECIRYIFKHYGYDFDNEIPELPQKTEGFPENGNILCQDCENCENCVMCHDIKNCKNCWFNWKYDNIEDEFSNDMLTSDMRDEPLTKEDYEDIKEFIEYIDRMRSSFEND